MPASPTTVTRCRHRFSHRDRNTSLQPAELGLAAHRQRRDAFDAAALDAKRARPGALDEVGDERLGDALDGDRSLGNDVEDAAHMTVGVVADPQPTGGRALLHARSDIDHLAANRALFVDAAAEQHAAGVHADADAEFGDRRRPPPAFVQQRKAAAHGLGGVVLAGLGRAERGEQAVAGVLQHLSAVRLDDHREGGERAVHELLYVLGLEAPAQRGRADDIGEQHADLAEDRAGRTRAQRLDLGSQRRDAGIDDRVAERGALRLQTRDRGFEPFLFERRHCVVPGGRGVAAARRHCTKATNGRRQIVRAQGV